jgi:hypothetical protein
MIAKISVISEAENSLTLLSACDIFSLPHKDSQEDLKERK